MNKIAYIIPYFGSKPRGFDLWLLSASFNSKVDFIFFTDLNCFFPKLPNIKVHNITFNEFKNIIQDKFSFEILIDRPWKICDFRPAFGYIFEEYLKGYEFWGYCDLDIVWGNFEKFITDNMLQFFDKIGFQGHSTLIKNTEYNNLLFKSKYDDLPFFEEVFSSSKGYCFDEGAITKFFERNNKKVFKEVNFAHLMKYDYNFYLGHFPKKDDYKNYRQIFVWEKGNLVRQYLYNDKIMQEEFLYIHFWCRPMTFWLKGLNENSKVLIYSDKAIIFNKKIDKKLIQWKGRKKMILFYLKTLWLNRRKITLKRIIFNLKERRKCK